MLFFILVAIEKAKNGDVDSSNTQLSDVFILLSPPILIFFVVLDCADTLATFPNLSKRFSRVSNEMKKQLILNVDSEVYDSLSNRIHPYQFSELFLKDVWCLMDISMKLSVHISACTFSFDVLIRRLYFSVDIPDVKDPSRTYQLLIHRLQALNVSRFKNTAVFMNKVAGIKRAAPNNFDQNVRKPLPPLPLPQVRRNVRPLRSHPSRSHYFIDHNSFSCSTSTSFYIIKPI